MTTSTSNPRIEDILKRLSALDAEKTALQIELDRLGQPPKITANVACPSPQVFSPDQKIEILLSLFRGRTDVFPKRWDIRKWALSPMTAFSLIRTPCLPVALATLGMIGGGKRKPTATIDVALIQSLVKKDAVDDIVANYGHLIVDECHHLSAVSFEAVARAFKGKYVLGLTATTTRKDGHHPIIFMQCGPIRYKVDAEQQAALRPFTHRVIIRSTKLQVTLPNEQKPTIQQLYAAVMTDESRNELLFNNVLLALEAKRTPLILTERKDHAALLAERLSKFCKNVIVMVGGQSAKQREQVKQKLLTIPESEERLLIATGRYIGEGFDDARLDTLFLAMPISWHGTLAQYAGRLHRTHHAKKEVVIYDYVDGAVPMLAKMADKRVKGYERLGYKIGSSTGERE